MAEPVKGIDAVLQFKKGGDYTDYLCAADFTLDISTELKAVKTVGDGVYKRFRGQSLEYSITLNGLIKINTDTDNSVWDMVDHQLGMVGVEYRAIFEDDLGNLKVVYGEIIVERSTLGAGSEGFATGNISYKGNGPITILDALQACDAEILAATVDLTNLPTYVGILITSQTGSTPMRYEYSVDGGGRLINYTTDFTLSGLSTGSHTVEIWPICDNGFDGISITKTFTVS